MGFRRIVAVLATASLAFWGPSTVPAQAFPPFGCGFIPVCSAIGVTCGAPRSPCPTQHPSSPWPAVAILIGTASVIVNAAYIWNSQCRELSSQEAMTSTFLPFLGIAFDAQASKCRH
ncbi:MAG: hypothetical protein E7774_14360 [Bradyrhizobium sp.]|nr:MAG: hypothetical protein E7774_14360 [Bradyrhizobium sp.]